MYKLRVGFSQTYPSTAPKCTGSARCHPWLALITARPIYPTHPASQHLSLGLRLPLPAKCRLEACHHPQAAPPGHPAAPGGAQPAEPRQPGNVRSLSVPTHSHAPARAAATILALTPPHLVIVSQGESQKVRGPGARIRPAAPTPIDARRVLVTVRLTAAPPTQ